MTEPTTVQSPSEHPQSTETSPAATDVQGEPSRAGSYLNGFLAALVAIYGILTALVVYAGSRADNLYYDNAFIAQALLSDASELSLAAQIDIMHDLLVLQQIEAFELSGGDPEAIESFYRYLSDPAQASLERSGELDDTYSYEVYFPHTMERERAMGSYDLAAGWSDRADLYGQVTTALAVGLGFAAWASLIGRTGIIRWMFAIIASLILVACLGFLGVDLATRDPLEEYVMLDEYEESLPAGEPEPVLAGGSYAHPSGAFGLTIPAGWELTEEDVTLALFGNGESLIGAEFFEVEKVYAEDEMQAQVIEYADSTLGTYEVEALEVQPEYTHASMVVAADGSVDQVDFYFQQQEMVIFVLIFVAPRDSHEAMQPTRDGVLDTLQLDPAAALAVFP